MNLEVGASVAGKYRLDRLLGTGGMGEVWAATQFGTRKHVALKFLKPASASAADTRRRLVREARAACAVRHPNVVQVHDVIELEDGAPVLVMELLEGESLEQRLRRDGRMSLGDLAAVLVRVVSAVGTAHALGIVHRDLKPDNIFLAKTPDGIEIKVLDFGIAKLTSLEGDAALTAGLTETGAMLGTPYYMSPEQAFGERRIDHRADIWSLGIILYRGLTGVLPTRADNIGQVLKIIMSNAITPLSQAAPQLPKDVTRLVDKMLSPDMNGRPADLREVKEVLELHAGVVVESFSAPAAAKDSFGGTTAPSAVTIAKRRRAPAAVYATAVIALGAAVAITVGVVARSRSVPGAATPAVSADGTDRDLAAPAPASASAAVVAAVSSTPPEPSASAKPTDAASSTGTAAPAPPRGRATATGARPSASGVASAIPSAQPAKTSLGGVVEKPPF